MMSSSALTLSAERVNLRAAELHNQRARALDSQEKYAEALLAIDQALAINPNDAADIRNRGVLLRKLGRLPEALESFESFLALRAGDPEVMIKRAYVLDELGRREQALACAEEVLVKRPNLLPALNARGIILENLGRYDEARSDFERMLTIQPDNVDALNNCGMVFARQGQFVQALAAYTRSLSLDPDQPQAFYNCALIRLCQGDWVRGLVEFESRWGLGSLKASRPNSPAPLWSGREPIRGKTLFIYHEQGYGDTLQCARYVPKVVDLGARVIFAVPPALRSLVQTLRCAVQVICPGDPLPIHDFQCPLMSLLPVFNVTPETIAREGRYLQADPREVRGWAGRLGMRGRRLRIGLVWSGRRYAPLNYPRDMSLDLLRPLFSLDAQFVALQKEMSDEDRAALAGFPELDLKPAETLTDFAATAALIENLDLVISVDTAVAHLAGALGKPVWLLNRYASCWRWLQEGAVTAWYPSMRIFRQREVGNWKSVVNEVRAAAAEFIERGPTSSRGVAKSHAEPAEKIRLVCATRGSTEEFFARSALGRSLPFYRTFPLRQKIELRLFKDNREGLPTLYNRAIEECRNDPATLVFIHDDVYLSDYYWVDHLIDGLSTFQVVGLAGNRRRLRSQASWMYLNDQFQRDSDENMSGVVGHGEGFPNLKQLSIYGEPGYEVRLLDGVLLGIRSETLMSTGLRFDPRFTFHFYDLDFCRQAELLGVKMGTWPISVIHASAGELGGEGWRAAYRRYLEKYDEL